MNLAQAVERMRPAILDEHEPDIEMLKCMAELVELNHAEYANFGSLDQDEANLQWSEFLLKKAKERGWFRLCIKHGFLPERYIRWPNHNWTYQPKLKEAKGNMGLTRLDGHLGGGALNPKRT